MLHVLRLRDGVKNFRPAVVAPESLSFVKICSVAYDMAHLSEDDHFPRGGEITRP
jgi:hypothetical protein